MPNPTTNSFTFYGSHDATLNNIPWTYLPSLLCWTNGVGGMVYYNATLDTKPSFYTSNSVSASGYEDNSSETRGDGTIQVGDIWVVYFAPAPAPRMVCATLIPKNVKTNILSPQIEIFGDSNSGTTNPIGQSLQAQNLAVGANTWPLFFLQQSNFNTLLPPINIYNWAIAGGGIANANNFYYTNSDYQTAAGTLPKITSQPRYAIFPPMVVNDIAAGTSLATVEAGYSNIWQQLRADHYIIVVSTATGDCGAVGDNWYVVGDPHYSALTNLNGWIVSQASNYDYFIDGFSIITTNNIAANSPHWNAAGQLQWTFELNNVLSNEVSNWGVPASSLPVFNALTNNNAAANSISPVRRSVLGIETKPFVQK